MNVYYNKTKYEINIEYALQKKLINLLMNKYD